MSRTAKWIITILVIVLAIAGWRYYGGKSATTETGPIKIGLSAPLTGQGASWGQNALAAATLAIKEVNDQGGVNGRQVELVAEDDKMGGIDAVNAITKLVNVDKVVGVVGPISSVAASPALPVAQKAGVPVVMIASAPALTAVGDYMFRIYPSDSYQGVLGAEVIYNSLGKKKVAVISVKNDYGDGLTKAFTTRYQGLGGQVVMQESFTDGTNDFRSIIAKVKSSGADSVYMAMYPEAGLFITKQMKEAKLDLPKVGDVVFNDEKIVKSGYAEGLIFTEPKSDLNQDFVAKLKSLPEFKDLSVMVAAPFTYDATKSLLEAIAKAGTSQRSAIRNALYKVSFTGVSIPTVEFGVDREIKNPAFNTKVIRGGQAVLY